MSPLTLITGKHSDTVRFFEESFMNIDLFICYLQYSFCCSEHFYVIPISILSVFDMKLAF